MIKPLPLHTHIQTAVAPDCLNKYIIGRTDSSVSETLQETQRVSVSSYLWPHILKEVTLWASKQNTKKHPRFHKLGQFYTGLLWSVQATLQKRHLDSPIRHMDIKVQSPSGAGSRKFWLSCIINWLIFIVMSRTCQNQTVFPSFLHHFSRMFYSLLHTHNRQKKSHNQDKKKTLLVFHPPHTACPTFQCFKPTSFQSHWLGDLMIDVLINVTKHTVQY